MAAMKKAKRSPAGEVLSGLVLDLFRLTSELLTAGDRLVARLGLTSARWQILGAIVAAERPQPVAWLARDLGANRQNVQRIVNDLHADRLVAFETNPHHRRGPTRGADGKGSQALWGGLGGEGAWVGPPVPGHFGGGGGKG